MLNIQNIKKSLLVFLFVIIVQISASSQTLIDFSTIPKSGTVLVYAHQDDDLIWMLPFWNISEKFIGSAMPATPVYEKIIHEQQAFLNNQGHNINYESNWITPWASITDEEYIWYYWNNDQRYSYLANDHLTAYWDNNNAELVRSEINKIKSKLEQYVASPGISRIITHNNWGEYGHQQHKAVNKAVRELAVKYRKDVWMLGCDNGNFEDVTVPGGFTYTVGNFDTNFYAGIRSIYIANEHWTWRTDFIPSGNHNFIKIVNDGNDMSNILTGEEVTLSGPYQGKPGAYIFDGIDNYLTLPGNNNTSFTIAMWIRPDQISAMDISKMTEYPSAATCDRSFYLRSNGHVTARINDGQSRTVTSTTSLSAGTWTHILMTGNGSSLKIYINGVLEGTVPAGQAVGYISPEFVLGQPQETSSFFKGQISDVRLYDYVLSDSEIATLAGSPPMTYTITASAGTTGTINPSGAVIVNQGSNRPFTITANSGYQITNVNVDGSSVGSVSSYTFNNVVANHTIAATFTPIATTNLTVSGVIANNKVYTGTTTAILNTGSAVLVGVLGGDVVSLVSTGATGTFANKNVGTSKVVTTSGFTLSGADAGNYTLTQPTTTANITAAGLTVSGVTAGNKVYNGTTAATLNTGSTALVGVLGGDVVSLVSSGASGTFANKYVGTAKVITTSGFTLEGTDAANYTLTQPATAANITTAGLTVSGITAGNKVYDGTTAATLNTGSATLVGVFGGDVVSLVSTGATGTFANKNIGTAKVVTTSGFTLSGDDAGNYTLTQPAITANITSIALTVTGVTANNKVYDRATTATLNTGSAALVGVFGTDVVNLNSSGATGTFAIKNVGTGKAVSTSGFTLIGSDEGNYTLTQPATIANITSIALNVTGITANNKVYDGTTAATLITASAVITGVLGTDAINLISSGSTGIFANKNVGTTKPVSISGFTIGGVDAINYTLTQPATIANITSIALTVTGITANNKVYDGTTTATLNTGSANLNGVLGTDVVVLISSGAAGTFANKNAGTAKSVSISGFTLRGIDAINYTLTQPFLTANITAAPLTVTGVSANNKVYDGTTIVLLNTGSALLPGVLGTDIVNVTPSGASGTITDKNIGIAKAVTVSDFKLGGADAGNYTLTQPSLTANVSAKTLTITANDLSKSYGTTLTFTGTEFTTTGLVSGDVVTGVTISSTGSPASADVAAYVISVAGGADINYDFTYVGGMLTVNKTPLIATADNKTKVYGSSNPVLSISYSGFKNGENTSVLDALPVAETVANMNSDAGNYDINPTGSADGNYSFIFNKGTLTINKADQVITFEEIPRGLRMTQKHQLNATASSGLQVSFEASDTNTGSLNSNLLTVNKEGNLRIAAMQEGDRNWNPAPVVTRSIVTLPTFDNISSLFTPNNDGMNDYWYIPDLEQYGKLQVTVYNRYGKTVYQSDSYKNNWDGTWNGYPLPSASYYYIIKSSEKGFIKGVVNIVR